MADSLDIAEVVHLTGLTARALRFYEARGLVKPLRTASGRRHYGPAELEQLHRVMAMKRAGLTLSKIQRLTTPPVIDKRNNLLAQMEMLREPPR
jgi:DNA-binding transcriptional MerR regulator